MRNLFPKYKRRKGARNCRYLTDSNLCQQRAAATTVSQHRDLIAFAGAAHPCSKELKYLVTKSIKEILVSTPDAQHHPGKQTGCAVGCSLVNTTSQQLLFTCSITPVQPLWLSSQDSAHSLTLTLETGPSSSDLDRFQQLLGCCSKLWSCRRA